MKCNHCNSEVADRTNFCPNCGKPANDFAQPNQGQPQSSYQGQYQQPYQTRYRPPNSLKTLN